MTPATSATAPVSAITATVTPPILAIVPTQPAAPSAELASSGGKQDIAPHHVAMLEAAAVDLVFALRAGIKSIRTFADLPKEVSYMGDWAPGLLFPLTDVHGKTTWQFRPDNPAVGQGKYLQEAGSGSVINFWPGAVERIPTAQTVMIVEGTKQSMAAARWAADDILILGIQGCGGWSHGGVPNGDLDALVRGKDVVIAFDGDIATNYNVYMAGERLQRHLLIIGAKSVKFIPTVTSAKAGLDDYVAVREDRTGTISQLVKQATPKLPTPKPRPVKKVPGKGKPIVDWDKGVICMAQSDDALDPSKPYEAPQVLLGVAVRILCSTDIQDDLNFGREKTVTHDLAYAFGVLGADDRVEGVSKGVPDAMFEKDVRKWLEQFEGSMGTHVERSGSKADDALIVATIRAAGSDSDRTDFMRTGQVYTPKREAVFLHAGGGISARGNTTETAAHLTGRLTHINFPDPKDITPAEAKVIWKQALDIVDYLFDPTAWMVLIASMTFPATGAAPEGSAFFVGEPGSGKTTLAQCAYAHYSPFFADNAMTSMSSTGNFVGASGRGAHQLGLFVDDAHPRSSVRAREDQLAALQQLGRTAYDGASATKGRMTKDVTGEWVSGTPDQSRFMSVVTAEELPEGGAEVRSLLERMLTVKVKKGELITEKTNLDTVEALARDGVLQKVFALYLMDMMAQAEKTATERGMGQMGVIKASADLANEARDEAAAWLHLVEKDLDVRGYRVPAAFIAGWSMYVAAALRAGAITPEKAEELRLAGRDRIREAARVHGREVLGVHTSRKDVLLDTLRVSVITETAYLGSREDEEARMGDRFRTSATCLGFVCKPRSVAEACVAIIPEAAMKLTGAHSLQSVHAALRDVAVLRNGTNITHNQTRNGLNVRVILIPWSTWIAEPTDDEPTDGGVAVEPTKPAPTPGAPVLTVVPPIAVVAPKAPQLASGLDYVPDQYGNDPRIEF